MRDKTSKLTIESFGPESIAAHASSFLQKPGLDRIAQDGLPSAEHMEDALSRDSPLPIAAKLPQKVGQASPFVADTTPEDARHLWAANHNCLRERAAELRGGAP